MTGGLHTMDARPTGATAGLLLIYAHTSNWACSIPTTGLVLSQGYIWPDRAVIRALPAADCLVQVDGGFVLTARGEALLAPFLKFDDGELAITFHSYKDREL